MLIVIKMDKTEIDNSHTRSRRNHRNSLALLRPISSSSGDLHWFDRIYWWWQIEGSC